MPDSTHNSSKSKDLIDPSWDLRVDSFIKSITKNVLRMQIFLLLYINPELYVTEISNKLNKSKATVSRHLNAMEKEGVLKSREVPDKRNVKRKYYGLPKDKLKAILPEHLPYELNEQFLDSDKRLKLYSKFIEILKSFKVLVTKGFDVVQPLINSMEGKLGDIESVDKEFNRFASFLSPERMILFETVSISKERVAEANALYDEYRARLYEIREEVKKNDEEDSILIVHSMVPLKDILEGNAKKA